MSRRQKRLHRFDYAERSLLFRLRVVHRDVCEGAGVFHRRVCPPRPVCQSAGGPRLALYGLHELIGEAGAKGRCRSRGHFGRSVGEHRQKRAVQSAARSLGRRTRRAHRRTGRNVSQRCGPPSVRARAGRRGDPAFDRRPHGCVRCSALCPRCQLGIFVGSRCACP